MTATVENNSQAYNWFGSNTPYIKPEEEKNIFLHKYKGGNTSMYYNYVQSPACDFLVQFLPVSLAPNVITVLGISCVFFSVVLMHCLYGFTFDGPLDSWFCYVAGVLYFSNTVLDNMDGKQARRTGAGSPMGMLFDHGSDAMTAIMSAILMGRILQIGEGMQALVAFFVPIAPFYFLNLQEYYTGQMELPNLTGPDDTQLLFCFMCFAAGMIGTPFFATTLDFTVFGTEEFRLGQMMIYLGLFVVNPSTFYGTMVEMYRSKDSEHFKKRFEPCLFAQHVGFIPLLCLVWFCYCLAPGSLATTDYFFMTYMCYGAQFLQAIHRMLVCDVTCAKFYPIRRTHMLVWTLLTMNGIALWYNQGQSGLFNEKYLLIFVNLVSWSAVCHQIYYTIQDFTRVLDIYCFSAKYPEKLKIQAKKL